MKTISLVLLIGKLISLINQFLFFKVFRSQHSQQESNSIVTS
jgi:hypothetical protein